MKCARMIWALIMLCAFASAVGAQVTSPVTTINQEFVEIQTGNTSGDLLSSATLVNDRPDTLRPLIITVVLQDTIIDSTAMVLDVSTVYGGGSKTAYRDTVNIGWQLHLPERGSDVDSIFTVELTNASPTIGDRFQLKLVKIPADQGYTTVVPFASSTVSGTDADTSAAIYIGRGAMDVSFGFEPLGSDTTAATYRALYNLGLGWGMSVPADTIADSTYTWARGRDGLHLKDVGELLGAPWIKLIRNGTRATDTTTVRETIRIEPR